MTSLDRSTELRPFLVIGATGTVGRAAVAALLARQAPVAALVRSTASAARLPGGVTPIAGDLDNAGAVATAVGRARAVLFINPHDPAEERYAQHVVAACERAQVRLVYLGVHLEAKWAWLRALMRAVFGAMLPHYKGRFRNGERVRSARTKTQLLLASTFFQNEEVFLDDILAGRYTQPLGDKGVTAVDARDIGEVAARVLLDESLPAGCFPISGAERISGPDAAQLWSEALGRPVVYAGDDRAAWQAAIDRNLTGPKRSDFHKTFKVLARLGSAPSAAEVARTTELLGRPPRSYASYIRDVVAARGVLTAPARAEIAAVA
jgi:uncharacterized protein YbjT (DUF2867 family)